MKILNEIPSKNLFKNSSLTIGSFDGIHLGHQSLIKNLVNIDQNKSVIISFYPLPKSFFMKETYGGDILLKDEKINILKNLEIDLLCIIKFDEKVRTISSETFLKKLITAFQPKNIIVGYNHFFGHKKEGDLNFLLKNQTKYNFNVIKIDEYKHPKIGQISSTIIRNNIKSGNISSANKLLGYKFTVSGKVVNGKKIGRKIGFPTANLKYDNSKILPRLGVYFISSEIFGTKYYGMCNIGFKPTVSQNQSISIEIHFFQFEKNIYDKNICIEFISFIREEKTFKNLSLLKKQLNHDMNKCLEFCDNNV